MPPGDKIPKERICGSDLTSSDLRVDVIGEMLNVDLCEHRSHESELTLGGPIRGPRSVANENAEDIDLSQARAGGWR